MTELGQTQREIELLQQKREAAELVANVSLSPDYRAMVSFYDRSKARLERALVETEMPEFDRGFIRGQLRMIDDFCKSHDEAVARIAELDRKIVEKQGKLRAQQERSFRSPPPTMSSARPPVSNRKAPFPGVRR